jgi:hypothetical protein
LGKIQTGFLGRQISMTPQEQERLQACITEIAQILYNNTAKENITTLEGIEKAIRQQMMEHVSPKIALFLLKN